MDFSTKLAKNRIEDILVIFLQIAPIDIGDGGNITFQDLVHCGGIIGKHGPLQFCDLAVHRIESLAHCDVVQVVEFRENRYF
jgi:hypothetical protein